MRSRVPRLFDSHDENKAIWRDLLVLGQMEILLIFSVCCCSAQISWLLAGLEALVLDVVPLLLHVVGDVDLGHENFLAACDLKLVVQLLLSNLSHFLIGSVVELPLLDEIVALALLQQRFLLDTDQTKED